MRLLLRVAASLALGTPCVLADGKVFSDRVPVVEMPDQQAIVVFADGRERLVIETRYEASDGARGAWVIPTPSPPEVSAASSDLFRTLEVLTAPRVHAAEWTGAYIAAWMLAFAAGLAILVSQKRQVRFESILLLTCVTGFAASLWGPSMWTMFGTEVSDVSVRQSARIGAYDITTVTAVNHAALLDWLRERGLQVPPRAAEVVEDQVRDGWAFTVAELTPGGAGRPAPLRFDFETDRPVYPMRLTGAASNRPLTLDLYVFGEGRASCPHLELVHCAELLPWEPVPDFSPRYGESAIAFGDAGLHDLAHGARVLTRLSGVLSPSEMDRDLEITWSPAANERSVVDSNASAAASALGAGGMIAAAFAFFAILRDEGSWRPRRGRRRLWWRTCPLLIGIAVAATVFLSADRRPTIGNPNLRATVAPDAAARTQPTGDTVPILRRE